MSDDRGHKDGRYCKPKGRSSPSAGASSASCHGYDGSSSVGRRNLKQISRLGTQKWVKRTSRTDNPPHKDCSLPSDKEISSDITNLMAMRNSAQAVGDTVELEFLSASAPAVNSKLEKDFGSVSLQSDPSNQPLNVKDSCGGHALDGESESCGSSHCDMLSVIDSACVENCYSPPVKSGTKNWLSNEKTQHERSSHEKAGAGGRTENFDSQTLAVPFDICPERTGTLIKLKAPLLVKNREKRNEIKRVVEGLNIRTLRSGMVLLKSYISSKDQVSIVKKCRELGLGSGGFYQPGYREGAKMHLKMMCLGKHWEPEISEYVDQRPNDGAKSPMIPAEFCQLVKVAIQDSHAHLQQQGKARNGKDIFPSMSPNICIVNFYTKSGQLGLHQDKDESPESIHRGLPVVSFSIGDAAEFLYCDQRDIDKADKVILESGDVLIFGGRSRLIFHGVTAIHPGTAPASLLEESNLLPGRLNLTFREY